MVVAEQLDIGIGILRCLLYLHAMFIGACEKGCFAVPAELGPSFEDVGQDQRVQMSDMGCCDAHNQQRLRQLDGVPTHRN